MLAEFVLFLPIVLVLGIVLIRCLGVNFRYQLGGRPGEKVYACSFCRGYDTPNPCVQCSACKESMEWNSVTTPCCHKRICQNCIIGSEDNICLACGKEYRLQSKERYRLVITETQSAVMDMITMTNVVLTIICYLVTYYYIYYNVPLFVGKEPSLDTLFSLAVVCYLADILILVFVRAVIIEGPVCEKLDNHDINLRYDCRNDSRRILDFFGLRNLNCNDYYDFFYTTLWAIHKMFLLGIVYYQPFQLTAGKLLLTYLVSYEVLLINYKILWLPQRIICGCYQSVSLQKEEDLEMWEIV